MSLRISQAGLWRNSDYLLQAELKIYCNKDILILSWRKYLDWPVIKHEKCLKSRKNYKRFSEDAVWRRTQKYCFSTPINEMNERDHAYCSVRPFICLNVCPTKLVTFTLYTVQSSYLVCTGITQLGQGISLTHLVFLYSRPPQCVQTLMMLWFGLTPAPLQRKPAWPWTGPTRRCYWIHWGRWRFHWQRTETSKWEKGCWARGTFNFYSFILAHLWQKLTILNLEYWQY